MDPNGGSDILYSLGKLVIVIFEIEIKGTTSTQTLSHLFVQVLHRPQTI